MGDMAGPVSVALGSAVRRARVLAPPLLRGNLLVHGAALGLLAFVTSIERAAMSAGSVRAVEWREAVVLWARLAPALTLLGTAFAWSRMHKARLALATFGQAANPLRWGAAFAGAMVGLTVLTVPAQGAPSAWVRGAGGWFHLGEAVPDVLGGAVTPVATPLAFGIAAGCVLAAPAGARAWSTGALAATTVAVILLDALRPGFGALLLALLCYSQSRDGAV
jgi:hypothetical protein